MRRLVLGVAILALAATTLTWAVAGDQDIAREITERLRKEQEAGNLRSFNVNLKVADGNVTLDGQVANKAQRALVSETARSVDGVKEIVSQLRVANAQPTEAISASSSFTDIVELEAGITDEEIASQIARSLSGHKEAGRLKGFCVEVTVKDGLVTMKGSVASAEQRKLALQVVKTAEGVKDLDIQLVVKRSELPVKTPVVVSADQESVRNAVYQDDQTVAANQEDDAQDRKIGEELTKALEQAKSQGNLRGFGIGVHVDRGFVWLRGEVSTREQQQAALGIASRIPGVRQVVNDLKIADPPVVVADDEARLMIAQEIGKRFQAAAQLGSLRGADLDVKVDGEEVLLTGAVATAEQGQLAVDLARQVPGVTKVLSGIAVEPQRFAGQALLAAYPMVQEASHANVVSTTGETVAPAAPHLQPPTAISSQAYPTELAMSPYMLASQQGAYYGPAVYHQGAMDQTPRPLGATRLASYAGAAVVAPFAAMGQMTGMVPSHLPGVGQASVPARYDHPHLPGYAWPSYAAHPNYAGVTYPKQYSPSAWPYIGPFYPYPQVPLGWRKVSLKWDDGWWQLNFSAK